MPDTSTILVGVLLLCGISAVWAIVELALTLRKTRSTVKKLSAEVSDTIERVGPLIDKTEAVVDELDPAVKQLEPLLDRMGVAVDAMTYDLLQAEEVIAHVSRVTSAGAQATDAISFGVSRATNALSSGLVGVIDRIAHKQSDEKPALPRDEQARLSSLPQESEAGLKRPFAQGQARTAYSAPDATSGTTSSGAQAANAQAARTQREYYEYPSGQAQAAPQVHKAGPAAEDNAQITDAASVPENTASSTSANNPSNASN